MNSDRYVVPAPKPLTLLAIEPGADFHYFVTFALSLSDHMGVARVTGTLRVEVSFLRGGRERPPRLDEIEAEARRELRTKLGANVLFPVAATR